VRTGSRFAVFFFVEHNVLGKSPVPNVEFEQITVRHPVHRSRFAANSGATSILLEWRRKRTCGSHGSRDMGTERGP